jgi:nucleoside-diphosphate-sugar epimerase
VIVLLTGHRGRLGSVIGEHLCSLGHEVRGFDLTEGGDVLDAAAVAEAVRGVESIVHVAGAAGDRPASPEAIMAANVLGTWHVLLAAEAARVRRVVYLSSGKALGLIERDPDYLPVDDDHRGLPSLPYALSKWLAEEMCAAFSARTGIETLCLRPVQVCDAQSYAASSGRSWRPSDGGHWHLGVHVDVRDVAAACAAALTCNSSRHERLLLSAADIAAHEPTRELVAKYLPDVEWRGGPEYDSDPYRSLIDCGRAQRVLRWTPRHTWPARKANASHGSART